MQTAFVSFLRGLNISYSHLEVGGTKSLLVTGRITVRITSVTYIINSS